MDLKHYLDKKKREKTKLMPCQVKSYTYQILQVKKDWKLIITVISGHVLLPLQTSFAPRFETAKSFAGSRSKHYKTGRFWSRSCLQRPRATVHTRSGHSLVSCARGASWMSGNFLTLIRKLYHFAALLNPGWHLGCGRNYVRNGNTEGPLQRRFRNWPTLPNFQNIGHANKHYLARCRTVQG